MFWTDDDRKFIKRIGCVNCNYNDIFSSMLDLERFKLFNYGVFFLCEKCNTEELIEKYKKKMLIKDIIE